MKMVHVHGQPAIEGLGGPCTFASILNSLKYEGVHF